ncbi:MAG: hypothetical protein HON53_22615 [Planctomycetaceae bacterium]|nr:hypothetical protein [Planctomycetaceae bacterium]MBT6158114.1 hypothetical protein [Planctomycetaceae bacterium]MBT6485254.1 hypothetical protein [Planctomycetaceae bacterium]MBT6494578.1 hypothetical protein [Planctomycetaceae bacterium]
MTPSDTNETSHLMADLPGPLHRRFLGYLYSRNPFYLLSVCFVFHGTAAWFQNEAALHNPWPLVLLTSTYIVALAVTAFVIVRFGKVWDDARSIFLIVLILFVEMSVCFDDVLAIYPEIGKPLLIVAWLLAVCVSEGLMLSLRIRLPALFRVPFHLMLALLFLYPFCLIPGFLFTSHDAIVKSWRIFLFSPAIALALLSTLPAVRRGPSYVGSNGTPWSWPWFPWTALGTIIIGLCIRSYAMTLSFDPALSVKYEEALALPSAFGGYFLVPVLLAMAFLLLETGVVTGNRQIERLALFVPFACIFLAIPAGSPNAPYAEFLNLFMQRLASPVWLTAIGSAGFLAYALFRRVSGAERALVVTLLLLSVTGPETVGLDSLVPMQAIPLLLIAGLELGWGLRKADSRRTLLGALCSIAAVHTATAAGWTSDVGDAAACHLALAATIIIGTFFRDPFSRLLQQAGAVMLFAAGVCALILPFSAPAWAVAVYMATLIVLSFLYAWSFSNLVYLLSGLALTLASLCTLGWHTYLELKRLPAWKGVDSFLLAAACLVIATIISLIKGGIARKFLAHIPRLGIAPRPPAD